ncbi:MAG: hypothetical protein AAFY56_07985 [Pseudomonadota bacterium]
MITRRKTSGTFVRLVIVLIAAAAPLILVVLPLGALFAPGGVRVAMAAYLVLVIAALALGLAMVARTPRKRRETWGTLYGLALIPALAFVAITAIDGLFQFWLKRGFGLSGELSPLILVHYTILAQVVTIAASFALAFQVDAKFSEFLVTRRDRFVGFGLLGLAGVAVLALAWVIPEEARNSIARENAARAERAATRRALSELVHSVAEQTEDCTKGSAPDGMLFPVPVYAPGYRHGSNGRHPNNAQFTDQYDKIRSIAVVLEEQRAVVGRYTDGRSAVRVDLVLCIATRDLSQVRRWELSIDPFERVRVPADSRSGPGQRTGNVSSYVFFSLTAQLEPTE